jgi:hypothetical protein
MDGLEIKKFGKYSGNLDYITAIWYILWSLGNLVAVWYLFPRFGKLCREEIWQLCF